MAFDAAVFYKKTACVEIAGIIGRIFQRKMPFYPGWTHDLWKTRALQRCDLERKRFFSKHSQTVHTKHIIPQKFLGILSSSKGSSQTRCVFSLLTHTARRAAERRPFLCRLERRKAIRLREGRELREEPRWGSFRFESVISAPPEGAEIKQGAGNLPAPCGRREAALLVPFGTEESHPTTGRKRAARGPGSCQRDFSGVKYNHRMIQREVLPNERRFHHRGLRRA